jgi:RNA 2',3'-cyclic 3'-phosphodiesterase
VSERLRLFVALDLPAAARDALATWCDRAAPAGVRRIPAHDLHLTLAFLGPRLARDAAAVAQLLPGVALAHPVRCLRTTRVLWLGPRRPSVLSVAIEADDELAALRAGLVATLAAAIGFGVERRPFLPHVTVGRVGGGARVGVGASLLDPPPTLTVAPHALTLYRSHTDSRGARYEPLARELL